MNAKDKLIEEIKASFGADVAVDAQRLANAIEKALLAILVHAMHQADNKD